MVANALDATFSKGDAIAIDMPMTISAVVIYLAIVLAGFVVVSIADSFAAKEIATRLRVSNAKAIFTQVIFPFPHVIEFIKDIQLELSLVFLLSCVLRIGNKPNMLFDAYQLMVLVISAR